MGAGLEFNFLIIFGENFYGVLERSKEKCFEFFILQVAYTTLLWYLSTKCPGGKVVSGFIREI